ncbi:hypothetical protein OV208_27300 [Corallococcus sp. bb12-1]|uniref:hypothetical protein n=1 Tax=Corallococcus sp. bb12-1 TaxID=2996784 RepID=UPI00226EA847|nr:hypothetical protein [Corallococcus sp. bb12-1]MCY1045051.1 hypothetical protein [Corallococcus sp. bb12-1]
MGGTLNGCAGGSRELFARDLRNPKGLAWVLHPGWRRGALVASHCSWNRTERTGDRGTHPPSDFATPPPTGKRVASHGVEESHGADRLRGHRVPVGPRREPATCEVDGVTGFKNPDLLSVWGRPVEVAPCGGFVLSDEQAGALYRREPAARP